MFRKKHGYLKFTPSFFSAIINNAEFNQEWFTHIKFLMLGGEASIAKDLNKFTRLYPSKFVMNHYGPTETTIGSITKRIEYSDNHETNSSVPIGTPIDNTQVYIVDFNNSLVPVGVIGELLIGGDGVAVGYLNQKELTKKKFIKNPYTEDSDSILYKTGDLARYLPNGDIEFHGRLDNQVKIRGLRIELDEIETKISEIDAIKKMCCYNQKK